MKLCMPRSGACQPWRRNARLRTSVRPCSSSPVARRRPSATIGEASDIVRAVPRRSDRHDPVGVLDDPDVVDECLQVRRVRLRQRDGRAAARGAACAELHRLAQHLGGLATHLGPGQRAPDRAGLGPGGGEAVGIVEEVVDGPAQRGGIVEGHEDPGARPEQVLRVEVRRRHRGAAGHDREGQGAGHDLLPRAVGREEEGRRREHGCEVLDVQEAVVEDDVVGHAEIARQALERDPVLLAMGLGDLGVGSPGDDVARARMAVDDGRHGRDRRLDPLARRDQAERRQQGALASVGIRRRRAPGSRRRPFARGSGSSSADPRAARRGPGRVTRDRRRRPSAAPSP